jgi:hypothetical protein
VVVNCSYKCKGAIKAATNPNGASSPTQSRANVFLCVARPSCGSREQLMSGSFVTPVPASMVLNVVLLVCACCGVLSSLLLMYGIYRVSDPLLPGGGTCFLHYATVKNPAQSSRQNKGTAHSFRHPGITLHFNSVHTHISACSTLQYPLSTLRYSFL